MRRRCCSRKTCSVVVRNACRRRTRQGPRQRGLRPADQKAGGDPFVARAQMRRRLLPPQPGRRVGRQREEDANRSPTGVPGYIVDLRMSLIVAARRSVPAGIALQNRRWPGLIGRATCRGEIVRGGFNERQASRLPFWFRQRDSLSSETRRPGHSPGSHDWASCRC